MVLSGTDISSLRDLWDICAVCYRYIAPTGLVWDVCVVWHRYVVLEDMCVECYRYIAPGLM